MKETIIVVKDKYGLSIKNSALKKQIEIDKDKQLPVIIVEPSSLKYLSNDLVLNFNTFFRFLPF